MDRGGMVGLVDAMAFLLIAILICASLSIAPSEGCDVPERTTEAHRTLLACSIENPCGPGEVSVMERISMESPSGRLSNGTTEMIDQTLRWLLGPSIEFGWELISDDVQSSIGGPAPQDRGISTDRVITNDVHGRTVVLELSCWWS